MTKFKTPDIYKGPINPNDGFLCFYTCWRPPANPSDTNIAGEKLQTSSFIPVASDQPCLCGSGKPFKTCCRRKRLWYPICPNPGIPEQAGYSHLKPQIATFTKVDGAEVRERLMADSRLQCTEDTTTRAFWIYEGDPAIQIPQGVMCFGDLELERSRTLIVTAMSDLRMHILQDLLHKVCGDVLGRPKIKYESLPIIDKRTGKSVIRTPSASSARR